MASPSDPEPSDPEPSDPESSELDPPEPEPSDPPPEPAHVTGLLQAWAAGDPAALEALLPAVYGELRRRAARALRRESPGHTLQTTDLVHEAYLRLVDQRQGVGANRAQFLGLAAVCMRRVLVDHARARQAAKRGGGARQITLTDLPVGDDSGDEPAVDVLALDDALRRLAQLDPQQGRVVELRYFGGLNIEETAAALGVSPSTVKREWAVARAWLRRELAA